MILLSLSAVIGLAALLVTRQTENRSAIEFFAAADESSDLHASASAELESLLSSIGIIDRQDLSRRLQDVADTAQEANLLLDLEVPSMIGNSYGTMTTASTSWTNGTVDLNSTITAIMDGDLFQGATGQLRAALDLLRVGDTSYSLFLDTLDAAREHVDIGTFETVTYINPDTQDRLLYDAQSLVLRIQTSYDLSPHHDVGVVGMTVPKPVGEAGRFPVVPFSDVLDVTAIVTNFGNQDEATVDVALEAFSIDSQVTIMAFEQVTDLKADTSTTVTFADIGLEPGGLYQITVTVTITNDIDPDNDVWDLTFFWRAET